MRLLTGLLGAEGRGVLRSEAPLAGGRSDLLITDVGGRAPLLVVEYKQRHSGQASACQQQDTAQVGLGGICTCPCLQVKGRKTGRPCVLRV